jgi:hypothetical protein
MLHPPSSQAASAERPESTPAFVLVALLLSLATAGAFFVIPYLPTNDGPGHILGAWWWNHLDTPGQLWSERVTAQWPQSGAGFVLFFWLIEPFLGWRVSTQAILAAVSLGAAWGVVALGRALHGRWHWPTLLAFAAAFSWPLYMGFFNFLVAAAFVPWIATVAVRHDGIGPRGAIVLAPVLLFVGWLHLFAALAAGVVLGAIALFSGARVRSLGWLAAGSLPVLGLIAKTIIGGGDSSVEPIEAVMPWLDQAARFDIFARTIVAGPRWRAEAVVAIAAVGALAAVAAGRQRRALGLVALAFVGVALLGPFNAPGWQGFAPRFGGFAVAWGLAAAPWPTASRLRRPLAALVAAYALAAVGWAWSFHATLAEQYALSLEGLGSRAPSNGYRAFIPFEPTFATESGPEADVPLARFGPNTAAIYVLRQGGIAKVFHSLPVSPVRIAAEQGRMLPDVVPAWGFQFGELVERAATEQLAPSDARTLSELERHWVAVAASYDDAILYGSRAARAAVIARGFDTTFDGDHVSLVKFAGCSVTFELPRAVPPGVAGVGVSGIGPAPVMPFQQGVPIAVDAAGTAVTLAGVPCGADVEVLVRIDADGVAGDAGDLTCGYSGAVVGRETRVPCAAR